MVFDFLMWLGILSAAPPGAAETQEIAELAFSIAMRRADEKPDAARGGFALAADVYSRILRAGFANPALYRNLGQACMLARNPDDPEGTRLPEAILAFQRGLRLAPHDRGLQRALAYARQQVVYPAPGTFGQPAIEHRPPWLPRWPGWLFGLAVVGYSATCLCLARWWMVRRGPWLTGALAGGVVALVFLSGWALEVWQLREDARSPLVVVARDGVQLLAGNGSRYPPRYDTVLNRGVEARLRFERGSWLQIELAGGELGWVPAEAVLVDR